MTAAAAGRSNPWLAALVAGALSQAGCGGDARPAPSYTKIDDMEGPGRFIPFAGPDGSLPGGWWAATDCSQADRISPPMTALDFNTWSSASLPTRHETLPGITSTQAVRFRTTSPIVGGWGAVVGLGFAEASNDGGTAAPVDAGAPPGDLAGCMEAVRYYPNVPIDLTAYAGVTFWARAESPGSRLVRVQVNDVSTDPRGGICRGQDGSTSDCYNAFGTVIELTETFRRYTLDFSLFKQKSAWGYHPPSGIDWTRIYSLAFELTLPNCVVSETVMCAGGGPMLRFDIWIDDLYFVNK
jgi:hypothetical protein